MHTEDANGRETGIDRRTALQAVGGTALAVALAGCNTLLQEADDDGGDGGNGGGDVPDEPIQAGLQTYTEGAPAVLGLQAQYGAELAVQRINEAGGVGGREIELDVVHEADAWVDNYRQFVDEGKEVTFGPISSGGHAELAPEVESQQVVNVATDGTVTTLYEETVEDPTYSFRFQNHDVMECVGAALEVVERFGADEVETIAGINPNYAFGQDEMETFTLAMEQLADVEVVYDGYPDLGAEDMSTHITEVNDEQPDITFTSCWGGDVTTLLEQAEARDMFDNTQVVGSVLYSAVNDLGQGTVEAAGAISGSRNFYWGSPSPGRWPPGEELVNDARDEWDILPSAHFISGYGAVAAWATAVDELVDLTGGWPDQDQIAAALEDHGFYTPAGFHVMASDHQGRSNAYYGEMTWSSEWEAPVLEDVNVYGPRYVAPPPGDVASEWLEGWE